MTQQEFLFGVLLCATVAVLAFSLSGLVFRRDTISARLSSTGARPEAKPRRRQHVDDRYAGGERVAVMERISHAAARPFMPKSAQKQSSLRRQLMHAGLYTSSAMELFVGVKVILLAVGLMGGYLLGAPIGGTWVIVIVWVGGAAGYVIPAFWLSGRIKRRRRSLDAALPDALDLMVVCVESGLTLDASIQRVGSEIALAHPDISREFGITHMETRVGLSRIDALRNLGQRTGCASLQSLAAMLVQTERFGTSIAQALRVHAESLRTRRQHAAEEQAAKTTVKLAFPVVLFIFPTLLVVLAGPAAILLWKSPMFTKH